MAVFTVHRPSSSPSALATTANTAAETLIKDCSDQINTHMHTQQTEHRPAKEGLSMKATCFALVTVISSKVPSVKLSSCWWEIYSNLLRFSLHEWHNQADWCVAPQSAPQKWCVGVEWACPQRLSKGENVRPVVYANFFETMLLENKLWKEKKSNLNA